MRNKFVCQILCFLFAILIFAQPQQDERVLKIGIESDLSGFDPWETGYAVDAKIIWNIFEPLVTLEENSTTIKPYLATSWSASNNNRTWILKLREGVKFHHGSSLTAEAGYIKGIALKLVCIPRARPYVPNPQGVAAEIKKQMAEIGVKINVVAPPTYDEFASIITGRDYDLVLSGWIDVSGDLDYTLDCLLSSKLYPYNLSRWSNKLFDEKPITARQLPSDDVSGRIRLYDEAQKIFQQEAPRIPLFHTKIFLIHNRRVKEIIFYPSSMISYYKVTLES